MWLSTNLVFYFTGCTSESCSLSDMLHSIYSETVRVVRSVSLAYPPYSLVIVLTLSISYGMSPI